MNEFIHIVQGLAIILLGIAFLRHLRSHDRYDNSVTLPEGD